MPAGNLLPWTGEEVVFEGFGADLGMDDDATMPVVEAYRKLTGNVRITARPRRNPPQTE